MKPAIWTAIYPKHPLPEAIRALHSIGWQAFEVATEHLAAIAKDPDARGRTEQAMDCLSELGVTVPQAHAHLAADVAATDRTRRERDITILLRHTGIAAGLGVETVVVHPGGGEGFTTRAEQQQIRKLNVEAFRRLGDFVGEHKMKIGIENLMRRDAATPAELMDLLAAIDHPAIGLTLDTSHVNAMGMDVAKFIRDLGPRIVATHISDNNGTGDQHLVPGGGNINWPEAMRALREVNYNAFLNMEIPGERHPLPALQKLKLGYAFSVLEWLIGLADSGHTGILHDQNMQQQGR